MAALRSATGRRDSSKLLSILSKLISVTDESGRQGVNVRVSAADTHRVVSRDVTIVPKRLQNYSMQWKVYLNVQILGNA